MRLRTLKDLVAQFIGTIVFLLCIIGWPLAASAIDLNVQSGNDYKKLLDGIRAAEYTRQNYLESDPNPRAIVAIAGLWTFAERNPQATAEQLSAFISAYDEALANQIPGDAELTSFGSVLSAASGAAVASNGLLLGMDTRVSEQTLEVLGISLPGLTNYEQSRQRMTRFDLASVQRLIQRRETMDALTAILAGVTANGQRPDRLDRVAAGYLTAQGLAPQLGSIDASETEINAGLISLPTYEEFDNIRNIAGQHTVLEQENIAAIDRIQDQAEDLLQSIGTPAINLGQFLDSLSLTLSAADPDDPNHDAAQAHLEARRQAIILNSRATATQRAGVFARTLLLQQSSFEAVRAIATNTRSFAALQLQTNNSLAIAEQGIGIAGSLVGVFAGFKTDDPWGAVQSITDVVTGALGLASLFGDDGPSAEEQIFDQIVELRQQVEDMRVQLNSRFDIVDQKLNQVFSTMTDSFAAIGFQIGDLQISVDELAVDIAQSRSALDRIEDALFGFAQAVLLADLSQETNLVLNYFNTNGVGLPYASGTPSFVASTSFFYTFATTTAKDSIFAGTPEDVNELAVTLDTAATTLGDGQLAVARRLNDLRRLPEQLMTSSGIPVGPLMNSRIAAPAPWAQGAAAYLQLARENPWYFNYQLNTQINSGGSTRIDDIIDEGERIISFANTVRTDPDLFDALLTRASDAANEFKQATLQQLDQVLIPQGYSNGIARIDPWGAFDQPASSLRNPSIRFNIGTLTGTQGTIELSFSDFIHSGFEVTVAENNTGFPVDISRAEIAERNALTHIFEFGSGETPQIALIVNQGFITETDQMDQFDVLIISSSLSGFNTIRTLSFTIEVFNNSEWQALRRTPIGVPAWEYFDFLNRAFGDGLLTDLANGNLEESSYDTDNIFLFFPAPFPVSFESRIRVLSDTSSTSTFSLQTEFISDKLFKLRQNLRPIFISELNTSGSLVSQASLRLDNDAALLDAYLTIGMADALTQSELLRSAVRGQGSIAGLGFRGSDIEALALYDMDTDTGQIGGTIGATLTNIDQVLNDRINALRIEINEAAANTAPSFPYVEFTLTELRSVRDQAMLLAIDETYIIETIASINTAEGLLNNDIGQDGQISQQELIVDLDFFDTPDAVLPKNGSLVVAEDGSFTYTPDPGFNGVDRFSYRLKSDIPGTGQEARSEPADVIIRVGDFDDRIFTDGFEPGFQ